MAAPKTGKATGPPARKRQRKRKRRTVSSSSSSSSDSSSDSGSENEAQATTNVKIQKPATAVTLKPPSEATSGSDSSDSPSDSGSDAESDEGVMGVQPDTATESAGAKSHAASTKPHEQKAKARAASPPPKHNVPPPDLFAGGPEKEQQLKDRFRKFWLAGVADAFADDLNEIRKVRYVLTLPHLFLLNFYVLFWYCRSQI